jgi:hypothetical protein
MAPSHPALCRVQSRRSDRLGYHRLIRWLDGISLDTGRIHRDVHQGTAGALSNARRRCYELPVLDRLDQHRVSSTSNVSVLFSYLL